MCEAALERPGAATGARRAESEPGSATLQIALSILAGAIVAVLMAQLFATAGERLSLRNTADLAAVSAAIVLRDTGQEQQACAAAREVADGYRVACSFSGQAATVELEKDARFAWVTRTHAGAATAGPQVTEPSAAIAGRVP